MSRSSDSRNPSSSSTSSFSIATLVQYCFLAIFGYVLAGAPLQNLFAPSTSPSPSERAARRAQWRNSIKGVQIAKEKLDNLVVPDRNLSCALHQFKGVHVMSREPLVVYIEGFLSEGEVGNLVDISTPHFQPSTVWTAGTERLDPSIRLSEKAQVPRSSHTVQCIEDRARAFQGWRPYVFIEKLWAQRYGAGGHYTYHYDWGNAVRGAGRISSYMVWLGDKCKGGGTRFPRLERPVEGEWCRFIECGDADGVGAGSDIGVEGEDDEVVEGGMGITFKPIKGNAVYWENMKEDGTGFEESWHAGLPVTEGEKIGLNIWSWYQEGYDPYAEQKAVV